MAKTEKPHRKLKEWLKTKTLKLGGSDCSPHPPA